MIHRAIDGVSKDVLIVDKDGKVIARGRSVSMKGNEFVSILLDKKDAELLLDSISNLTQIPMQSIGHIRCSPINGMFIEPTLDLNDQEFQIFENAFGDTYAVSEFDLRYGMVPDFFKVVPGYRSAISS